MAQVSQKDKTNYFFFQLISNLVPDRLSTLTDSIFKEPVDEAIEQHRLNGYAIATYDEDGNAIDIQPTDITPLAEKLKQRQQ